MRALISVSDKTGLAEFAKELAALGYEIISTGGTAKYLTDNGIKNIGISDVTGFPECLDGRVKTLHPAVHAGLLAMRSNPEHMKQLKALNIQTIDLVAVNLYPFKATVEKGAPLHEVVENIDIGGPTMLRSAAKNYQDVAVVVDPKDYAAVIERLKNKTLDKDFKFNLMYKVFAHTAVYDSLISNYLAAQLKIEFPDTVTFAYEKAYGMRYGENPHQNAAFYKECYRYDGALTAAEQLWGKELSYNNINDANGALDILREHDAPCVAAVKHSNPCGVACAKKLYEAYLGAYECDPVSIYGGILAANREIDEKTALEINKIFIEIVIAPSFTDAALEVLKRKPNIRLLKLPTINAKFRAGTFDMKKVTGGLLVQDIDAKLYDEKELKVVTKRAPTKDETEQLKFAMKIVKHTKSNAIVVCKGTQTLGIGGGQTNRIWAARQAIERAGERAKGAVLASDAFFPFSDTAEAAAKAGITAIIQPGGSKSDADSIEMCDKYGMTMIFTGMRHFKH